MSHTNSTTNYNLPQFVGTDKPTWLNDVNGAFSAIDTQMKANADSATSAGTSATTANTSIGTLANLTTTEKTNLVGAINEVVTNVGTVAGVANNASADASNANAIATAVNQKLTNMFTFSAQDYTVTATGYTLPTGSNSLKVSKSLDGSICKIYGRLRFTSSNTTSTISTGDTGLRPEEDITINYASYKVGKSTDGVDSFVAQDFVIHPNGTITATVTNTTSWVNGCDVLFLPVVIFLANFGDTPTPND